MKVIEELGINGLKIIQDDALYRFTSDSVLLSRFVKPKKKDKIADFCSGSGIVGIHTYALNPYLTDITLFEMQEELYSMSVQSIRLNGLEGVIKAVNVKIQDIGEEYNEYFSYILCNPPYEKEGGGLNIEKREIAVCKKEITVTLEEIIKISSAKLKFGGKLALTHKAERLTDVMCLMRKYNIEPKRLKLVYGGKRLYLILIEGVKGGKSGLKIEDPLIN